MDAGVSIAIRHKRGSIRRDGNIRRVVERSLRRRLVLGAELAERSAIGGEDRDDVTVAVGDVHISLRVDRDAVRIDHHAFAEAACDRPRCVEYQDRRLSPVTHVHPAVRAGRD